MPDDIEAKGVRDLLCDAHAAELGIAAFHRDDWRNELRGRTFGTGFAAMRGGGKEQAVFPIHQRLVELEQDCRFDERAKHFMQQKRRALLRRESLQKH
jgi:hypothetical protein